ncbi:transporter, MscS family [Synechococcus sp. PCC 7335]|uniref:mechanosensitive ion channel family protein n=1 Tax=Synechococcus sp. (strain ATCC 29403 / PCC 7335) TaxID=91464 RepID=UPI00017EB133|nr:mechanosensitive ion channel family protein [Synechococcus sp. PCC 7335]EDX86107.1 transporter, MscS family [Synechococcus sp. PCC 7335]
MLLMRLPSRHWLKLGLAFVLALVVAGFTGQPGFAQFSLPDGFGQGDVVGPPSEVTRYGHIETILVRSPLNPDPLFTIASPTVYNRQSDASLEQRPVEQRAEEIKAKLLLLLRREMNPDTLVFEVSKLNNIAIIDVKNEQYPRPLVLVSVTANDADFNGQPIDELANEWRDILEEDIRSGLMKLPAAERQVTQIVLGLLLVTFVGVAIKYSLSRRQGVLRQRKKVVQAASQQAEWNEIAETKPSLLPEQIEQKRASFVQGMQRVFNLDRQLSVLDFVQWLLLWLIILAWYGGVTTVAIVSPYLLENYLGFLESLIQVLTIWFITGLAIRLCRFLIDYFTTERKGIDLSDLLTYGDAQRRHLRASTIAGALKGLVTVIIILAGLLSALSAVGLPTGSVVAIGSVAGLAITFGSQNLVKDLVNGFFILAEDQYAIGDVIDIGTAAGLVEALNLRVTQLRGGDGELVTIPNSGIAQVKNLTRSWSRVNFSVDVAYQTNPDEALSTLKEVAQKLYDDPDWHDKILAEPTVLGIDGISHSGITITIWIQTEPLQQWAVGRELRLRVRRAFTEKGIEIGMPTYNLLAAIKDK